MRILELSPLGLLYLGTLVSCYLSFWYSSLKIFRHQDQGGGLQKWAFKFLTWLVWNLSVGLILFFVPLGPPLLLAAGIMINLLVLNIFWLTTRQIGLQKFTVIYSLEQPQFHIKEGPYQFVRHPFYTSYVLLYGALIWVVPSLVLTALALVLIAFYYYAAKAEECSFLVSPLKAQYQAYQAQTGMFFPRLRNISLKNPSR